MDRRNFFKTLSLAIVGLNTSIKCVDLEAAVVTSKVKATFAKEIVDGLEVIMSTQPCDADYLQSTLVWWKDGRLYARRTIRWTRTVLKTQEVFQDIIKQHLDEAITSFKKEVDFYITNNVPHPPRIPIE